MVKAMKPSLGISEHFTSSFPSHADLWPALAPLFRPEKMEKEDRLLQQGEVWKSVYFIESGIVRLFYANDEGQEYNKDFFVAGDFFWPVAPTAQTSASLFSIAALTKVTLLKASYSKFKSLIQEQGRWEALALIMAERLAERKVIREASFLLDTPQDRYSKLRKEFSPLIENIPDYHIASFLGVTQVSLSRIKKRTGKVENANTTNESENPPRGPRAT